MGKFAEAVKAFAEETKQKESDVVVATIMGLSRRIIQYTPVGNPDLWIGRPPAGYTGGQAKGHWVASIGSSSAALTGNIDPNGQETINGITATAEGSVGDVFYLVNNLPYIRRLEYEGWSQQAPDGMVRRAVSELPVAFREALSVIN